ncbi:UDP-N-acetylmuramoyl-L-alanyl-D-glutamate--2,6-diaminopimelate ligase [Oceanobacillus sp. 143]|uniref:UDP-N-acetylmuramyl-tripeptide synthetase n=1 Tax=Oceanobacillus zhaokaii TaxID=2052660 RepID=A0A345PI95_9BACI|nr:UDP-N-acetylmuramoyl-L-alanyl-D-glutamate--2,6-diaminopimelate ligase [Oceanobacillus zhaokaii]AXI09725.1 UDP-N-acetylmuramoyl-L-alanyl-D-glutamate--2,6-diaminopimelate ligase [Oceanobacillus zhaokaii]QGS69037.1 UDP-N-acetylmuramoyl-L-alanyl-D-glutamate--2,6-diaminopimelate ligase [Oceanobacillus sp. 143]
MLLTSILQGLSFDVIQGDINQEIHSIAYDSRDVQANSVFVAISGFSVDGHNYIDSAIERGASIIIAERNIKTDKDVTILQVANTRNALALISANFYQHPTEKLNLIGITGTNGKTSISYFIKSIYEEAKKSIALIGTIGTVINDQLIQTKNTTPESLNLQQFFAAMLEENTENCMMEVSSHALNLDRVAYSRFNTGIFTNLTPDHLELHKNMDEYFEAKAKLFEMTDSWNIINADDPYGRKLADRVKDYNTKLVTYGIHNQADISATDIEYSFNHTIYTVNTPTESVKIKVNLPGEIYVLNSLAAIACAYYNGIPIEVIQQGINHVKGIKGRLEVVYEKDDFKVIVDFAHTEDALAKAINTLRPFAKGRIILVFGVYADLSEDGKQKFNGMAKVASTLADLSIITLDNPKHHDPNVIMKETIEAMEKHNGTYEAIPDRKEAIEHAINISNENDVILIAGKGHETTQIIGSLEIPFNEREIALDALAAKTF